MSEQNVLLRLYDLSHGMAAQLSPALLGERIDGIWHTGVVVFGQEYFYGGGGTGSSTDSGVSSVPGAGNVFARSHGVSVAREIVLGRTNKTCSEFESFLGSIACQFRCCDYSLFHHNCNNFSDVVSKFLVNKPIPAYITGLPAKVNVFPVHPLHYIQHNTQTLYSYIQLYEHDVCIWFFSFLFQYSAADYVYLQGNMNICDTMILVTV